MKDKIIDVIVSQFGCEPEQVKDTSTLGGDLCADDLDSIELCMALEDEFGIQITDDEWRAECGDQMSFTVGQIRDLVNKKLAAKKGK